MSELLDESPVQLLLPPLRSCVFVCIIILRVNSAVAWSRPIIYVATRSGSSFDSCRGCFEAGRRGLAKESTLLRAMVFRLCTFQGRLVGCVVAMVRVFLKRALSRRGTVVGCVAPRWRTLLLLRLAAPLREAIDGLWGEEAGQGSLPLLRILGWARHDSQILYVTG